MLTGIIAEFNPLHKGHELLISKAKEKGAVACVISGNFVQRGEVAISEKQIRVQNAIDAGADLVLELPVMWSMSTTQNFALGGVSILDNIGCDTLAFGSECGDIEQLIELSTIFSNPKFNDILKEELKKGITFALARQNTVKKLGGNHKLLEGANNNLGVEYINAAKNICSKMEFKTIKRIGSPHDSKEIGETVSASLLRDKLRQGDYEFCKDFMSDEILSFYNKNSITNQSFGERAILANLRSKNAESFKNLPDISEGVENKLYSSIKLAKSLDELYNKIKVKRYTHARIRRLVMSAFLGFENDLFMKTPPYIRVLGFNKKGSEILKKAKSISEVPIITRVGQISFLGDEAKKVFETENRATDLFSLFLENPTECGIEYTRKIIKNG